VLPLALTGAPPRPAGRLLDHASTTHQLHSCAWCATGSCPNACSRHGTCRNGQCECAPGYTYFDCSIRTCAADCSGQGACFDGVCRCADGFCGSDCSLKCCPNDCSGRGECFQLLGSSSVCRTLQPLACNPSTNNPSASPDVNLLLCAGSHLTTTLLLPSRRLPTRLWRGRLLTQGVPKQLLWSWVLSATGFRAARVAGGVAARMPV
jgi:hypothetical protein